MADPDGDLLPANLAKLIGRPLSESIHRAEQTGKILGVKICPGDGVCY